MIRMVVDPKGLLVFDLVRRLPGRGAYFCPSLKCLTEALKAKRLRWAFRKAATPPALQNSLETLRRLFRKHIISLLGLAARAGNIISGHDAVIRSIEDGRAGLLVIARDLAPRTRNRIIKHAGGVSILEMGTKLDLGLAIGYPNRGVLSVTNLSLAGTILKSADKSASLGLTI